MSSKNFQIIVEVVESLPEILIEERKRLGMTQKQLAEKLGIKEQQVQRYEATRYQSASLQRLCEVAKVLAE
jgi:ribosome-binding protein aMBF1 (putative translation factor)